jgi:hypothetical protein
LDIVARGCLAGEMPAAMIIPRAGDPAYFRPYGCRPLARLPV